MRVQILLPNGSKVNAKANGVGNHSGIKEHVGTGKQQNNRQRTRFFVHRTLLEIHFLTPDGL